MCPHRNLMIIGIHSAVRRPQTSRRPARDGAPARASGHGLRALPDDRAPGRRVHHRSGPRPLQRLGDPPTGAVRPVAPDAVARCAGRRRAARLAAVTGWSGRTGGRPGPRRLPLDRRLALGLRRPGIGRPALPGAAAAGQPATSRGPGAPVEPRHGGRRAGGRHLVHLSGPDGLRRRAPGRAHPRSGHPRRGVACGPVHAGATGGRGSGAGRAAGGRAPEGAAAARVGGGGVAHGVANAVALHRRRSAGAGGPGPGDRGGAQPLSRHRLAGRARGSRVRRPRGAHDPAAARRGPGPAQLAHRAALDPAALHGDRRLPTVRADGGHRRPTPRDLPSAAATS